MATFNILYATKVNLGGWATFTVHLVNLLRREGHEVRLCKIGNNTENFERPFGAHGVSYRNISRGDLVHLLDDYCIVAALGKHYVEDVEYLIEDGAGIVVHDTAESTNRMSIRRPWCIRKGLATLFDDAVFIRHPYVRVADADRLPYNKRRGYVATSRVDFDKNTTMILDANRLGAKIDIVGFENRLYTKFKVCPHYSEWVQSKGDHPRSGVESFALLCKARSMVDLTDIKGDGGGTQYTFLEAWDAGAVPVIGTWWLSKKDDMQDGKNCLAVYDAQHLATLCKRWPGYAEEVAAAGAKRLRLHGKAIVPEIIHWLETL
jgi:hypothetical protein